MRARRRCSPPYQLRVVGSESANYGLLTVARGASHHGGLSVVTGPAIVANVSLGARRPNETLHRRGIYANGARV